VLIPAPWVFRLDEMDRIFFFSHLTKNNARFSSVTLN
jgi:hypothetical protein